MTDKQESSNRRLSRGEFVLGAFGVLITIALCVAAIYYRDQIANFDIAKRYGLLGC